MHRDSIKHHPTRICILLIGYVRLDLLRENIDICENIVEQNIPVYISIDGERIAEEGSKPNLIQFREALLASIKFASWKVRRLESNLGPDKHIVDAIDWVLNDNDGVLVIEDDVKLSPESILEMIRKLSNEISAERISPIIAMSSLASTQTRKNIWRSTPYFTAWGFALSNEFWKLHQKCIADLKKSASVDDYMKNSQVWKKFSRRKKEIWRERVVRGNYDYAIQSTLFHEGLYVSAPLFRVSDNKGHGDLFSTHTRFPTPIYLRKKVGNRPYVFEGNIQNRLLVKVLQWADSNTWAGDGWLSKRGRSVGVRTFLRSAFSRFSRAKNV
jgi:hypothetical protein